MNTLHDLFENVLKRQMTLPELGTRVIVNRFRKLGIALTRRQQADLTDRLKTLQDNDGVTVELTRAQLAKSTLSADQRAANPIPVDLDADAFFERFQEQLPGIVHETVGEAARLLLKGLKRDVSKMLKSRRAYRRGFEARLAKDWGRAFTLLGMLVQIALEAGEDFNQEFRAEAAAAADFTFDVLTRLHARACQVADEVLVLLRAGFADGAHARWRLLHEIAVVGFLVNSRGGDLAQRYVLHDAVESYRAATLYQQHCAALHQEPLTELEMEEVRNAFEALKRRFGPAYGKQYGWAAEALGKPDPKFSDLEQAAGLAHLHPYYKLASHNIHANPKGVFFKLGLLPDQRVLLAGPSNLGLADPGHGTAISLGSITVALLGMRPNIDRLAISEVVVQLEREIGDAFLAAHEVVQRRSNSQ
jgi:hypothetical protein